MTNTAKRLVLWFVFSGVLGILVAVALAFVARHGNVNPYILLLLWPPSFAGDPSLFSDSITVGIIEFGGNFIIYGIIGLFVGMVVEG